MKYETIFPTDGDSLTVAERKLKHFGLDIIALFFARCIQEFVHLGVAIQLKRHPRERWSTSEVLLVISKENPDPPFPCPGFKTTDYHFYPNSP